MRTRPLNDNQLIKFDNLSDRISKVLTENLDNNTRSFVTSLQTYFNSKQGLTPKQFKSFEKIESHFCPQAKEIALEWEKNYNDEARLNMKICAQYYVSTGKYFTLLCTKALSDPTFIPTESEYNKITQNKFAQKVINETLKKGKFNKNDLVKINHIPRGGFKIHEASKLCNKMAFIIQVNSGPVTSACKGGKKYKILPFGTQHMIEIEERFLKKVKKDKNESNNSI